MESSDEDSRDINHIGPQVRDLNNIEEISESNEEISNDYDLGTNSDVRSHKTTHNNDIKDDSKFTAIMEKKYKHNKIKK